MRWFALLAFLLVPTLAQGATYYISPTGSNSNDGLSIGTPWGTFLHAVPQLSPGDTLILLDGVYNNNNSGFMGINCGTTANNGTAALPITVKAANERQAHIDGNGFSNPIDIVDCSYWVFEGLELSSTDVNTGTSGPAGVPFDVLRGDHITLKRSLLHHNNRYRNSHLALFYDSQFCLIEENEFYDYHRHGAYVGGSSGNGARDCVVRRNYFNSRQTADIAGGYPSGVNGWGDTGISIYPGSRNIIENNVVERTSSIGDIQALGTSIDNQWLGNLAYNTNNGVLLAARGTTSDDMATNTIIKDNVVINANSIPYYLRATKNTQLTNNTAINLTASPLDGFNADGGGGGLLGDGLPTVFFKNSLATGFPDGFHIANQSTYTIDYASVYNNTVNFNPDEPANRSNIVTVDPQMGSCYAYIPDSSPLKGAGSDGDDIGANVLYRYEDGLLTGDPLWHVDTGEFPCGAQVSGINDVTGDSCFDVHERLNVNTLACPFPAGFGSGGATEGGSWSEIPNSRLDQATSVHQDYSPNNPSTVGKIITAFSGGAYNSADNQLLVYGSGHCDGARGEIYGFDLDDNQWYLRSRGAYPTGWCSNLCPLSGAEIFSDPVTGWDTPIARHSYDMFFYVPPDAPGNFDNSLWVGSGSLSCGSGGFGVNTWTYPFGSGINQWSQRPHNVPQAQAVSTWSTVNGKGYYQPTAFTGLQEWDPVTDTVTIIPGTASSLAGLAKSVMFEHVGLRRLYIIGAIVGSGGTSHVRYYDLDNLSAGLQSQPEIGYPAGIHPDDGPGCAVRPLDNDIYCWAGANRSTNPAQVFKFDTGTGQWTTFTPDNGPAPNGATDVFGHWQYLPAMDKFAAIVSGNQNIFLWDPSGVSGPQDTTPPSGAIIDPTAGEVLSGSSVRLESTATDDVAVQDVQLLIDGDASQCGLELLSPYTCLWNTTDGDAVDADGSHAITARIRDTSGNEFTTAPVTITINNATDTTPPSGSVAQPSDGALVSGTTVLIQVNAADNVGVQSVQIRVDGSSTPCPINLTDPYTCTWDTTAFSDGSHTLDAVILDTSSNSTTTASISVTVDNATGIEPIVAGQWIARPAARFHPTTPVNLEQTGKHGRMAYSPLDHKIHLFSGDGTIGGTDSGNQEMFTYDMATDLWVQTQQYCRADKGPQPRNPDEVGWVWDTTRNLMWWVPGGGSNFSQEGTDCINAGGQLIFEHIMSWDITTNTWTDTNKPVVGSVGGSTPDTKFYYYDPIDDAFYGFRSLSNNPNDSVRVWKYSFASDAWSQVNTGQNNYLVGDEIGAHDIAGRRIWMLDMRVFGTGALWEYNIANGSITNVAALPAEVIARREALNSQGHFADPNSRGKESHCHWDSINSVVLCPIWFDGGQSNIEFLLVYDPDNPGTWEVQEMIDDQGAPVPGVSPSNATCPGGLNCVVRGRHSVFDPHNNALMVHRGIANGGPVFLYRYADSGSPPPNQCTDGIDNDQDGFIDASDPGCVDDDTELPINPPVTECTDGLDNDNDGFIDAADPGCLADNTELPDNSLPDTTPPGIPTGVQVVQQ